MSVNLNFCFLTQTQQTAFESSPNQLKSILENRLLNSSLRKHVDIAAFILEIAAMTNADANNRFIYALAAEIDVTDPTDCLKKVLEICKNGKESLFFQCMDTHKTNYYSASELCEMTNDFYQTFQTADMSSVTQIPCYDAGGKKMLGDLRNPPQRIQTPVNIPQITSLDDLLSRSFTFKALQSGAIRYLASLPAVQRLSFDIYSQFFSDLRNDQELKGSVKIGLVKAILLATTGAGKPLFHITIHDFQELLTDVKKVQQICGEETLSFLFQKLKEDSEISLEDLIRILNLILLLYEKVENILFVQEKLTLFASGALLLSDFRRELEDKVPSLPLQGIQPEGNIDHLIQRFAGNDTNVAYPLSEENLRIIKVQYETVQSYCEQWAQKPISALIAMAGQIRAKGSFTEDDVLRLVAIGRLAIRIKFQIYPFNTQVITVLGLLLKKSGCVAQVKTGEGKSTIVSLHAFVLTTQNQGVHIISSSQSLAVRDQIKYNGLFKSFGVTTSHICLQQPEAKYFGGQIVYGAATDFEFGLMREMLYLEPLFPQQVGGEKRFDNVMVDEVDNLTIDTALNGARLAYPAEVSYSWVFAPILFFVRDHLRSKEGTIHKLSDLRIHLKQFKMGQYSSEVDTIADERLLLWMNSAYQALHLYHEGTDYVIKEVVGLDKVKRKEVLIVDKDNTGRIMHGSRWEKGIHEFTEVKHEIEPKEESVNPISLSHPIFYNKYRSIFGLTGTLGSESEREEIRTVYGVDMFDVPTHKPSRRIDTAAEIVPTRSIFEQRIVQKVRGMIQMGRPVLVLCESIKESEKIQALLVAHGLSPELLNEMQEKNEEEIIEKAGNPGSITIATNTATRGTDIKLAGVSEARGGLHVLLTFYPASKRVEDQARGRAGRQGQPGSSEILLCYENLGMHQNGYSQEGVLEELLNRRQEHCRNLMHLHICIADIERFLYKITEKYFSSYSTFISTASNTVFLENLANELCSRQLMNPKEVKARLHLKDRKLAQEILRLMSENKEQPVLWKAVLRDIIERLKARLVVDWSDEFYQGIRQMVLESNIGKIGEVLTKVKSELNDLDQELNDIRSISQGGITKRESDSYEKRRQELAEGEDILRLLNIGEMEIIKGKILSLYDEKSDLWNKYFDKEGKALIDYIRDITDISLPNI